MASSADQRIVKLKGALVRHLDQLDSQQIHDFAHELDRSLATAGALQSMERSNTDPRKDKVNLEKSVKALLTAEKCLKDVGWHGQKTFAEVLKPFLDEQDYQFLINSMSRSLATERLLGVVQDLSNGLEIAANSVDLDGVSVMTAFDDRHGPHEFKKSKNRKTQAEFFAKKCGEVYFKATGTKPTVSNRQVSFGESDTMNEAYGPFLDFVKDTFSAADVQASPETWAKKAAKEFSPENEY